jgi:UDP-N-acetylmuramate--alanine ligase
MHILYHILYHFVKYTQKAKIGRIQAMSDLKSNNTDYKKFKKIYFIGIGGIGISALARLLKTELPDAQISGTDASPSEITTALEKEGIKINTQHDAKNIDDDIDCIIYTIAITEDNPEMIRARELEAKGQTQIFTYPEMLGKVSADKKTVAITGTHGKTTTTAMMNSALREAGIHPNIKEGDGTSADDNKGDDSDSGNKKVRKTNYIKGEDAGAEIFVTEACEYRRSFLNLNPTVLVITNIEEDHLDFYKDLADIKKAFMELADKVPPADQGGRIVCDFSDQNLQEIIEKHRDKVIDYSQFIEKVPTLRAIGEHNRINAAAVLATASIFSDDLAGLQEGLADFAGTWRRMESHTPNKNGALIFDDYAHHPTAIAAALNALRIEFPDKNLVVIFQPHLHSRTKDFFNEFVEVLKKADEVILYPIFEARQEIVADQPDQADKLDVSSEMLAENIPGARVLHTFDEIRQEINNRGAGDVVINIGAGDLYKVLE